MYSVCDQAKLCVHDMCVRAKCVCVGVCVYNAGERVCVLWNFYEIYGNYTSLLQNTVSFAYMTQEREFVHNVQVWGGYD